MIADGSFGETDNPASVKMAVRRICCLIVVLRRQRSGIGWAVVSIGFTRGGMVGTYEEEDDEVEEYVDGSTANEEILYVDT